MFEKIKEAFNRFSFLRPKDLFQIASIAKIITVKKEQHIIRQGDINYNIMLVLKGLLRQYVIDEQGVEKTLLFVPAKKPSGSPDTILQNMPATENIMALENSIILKIDFRTLEKLADDNIRLMKLMNQSMKELIISNVEQIRFLNILTPEERYASFCKNYPDLEQRVKQKHLASYLGITPTSLSRIRARMD